jgi:hypothetical protein
MNTSDNATRQSYYKLVKHNLTQYAIFAILFIAICIIVFNLLLPIMQYMIVEEYLEGTVVNTGQMEKISKESNSTPIQTDYYIRWAIDIYQGTPQEARYWFNPILSLAMPITLLSFLVAMMLTSTLPVNFGLMRHKIEREFINIIDLLHFKIFGHYSNDDNKSIEDIIMSADTRELLELADKWEVLPEDLRYIQKVIKWRRGGFIYRLFNTWTSLKFYLRFYFTDKYSNVVLGLVYIGAAVLIIIIGMRGLKFIPSTQPSLVFFALGLEFSVLITYAFTVMYSRNENEIVNPNHRQDEPAPLLSENFGNSKDVENLLRAFLKSNKKN